jgi:hypothetical protein
MNINLSKEKIQNIDLSKFNEISTIDHNEFFENPGKQHYKCLAYLSQQFNDCDIFDIGTHMGSSAIALSYNKNNTVHSFDLIDKISDKIDIPNINFYTDDLMNSIVRQKWEEKLLNSPIIFLDIDPYNGELEYQFYLYLLSKNYKGILIVDDIHHFEGMRKKFWSKVDMSHKLDITNVGHWSGTGIINISKHISISLEDNFIIPNQSDLVNDWTLITAYFDLTKCPDASESIKKRDGNYYLEHSKGTLSLDKNLVIFCDPEYEEKLRELRPAHLLEKTKFYPISFEDMELTRYRNKIIENRKKNPYYFDDRNTASYYLFCMSRYTAIQKIIEENPFHTSHFGWINICMERMGPKNLENLDIALSLYRDKFSTCYIDYIPPYHTNLNYLKEYYQWGRCSMCSGFFTGNREYMYRFCQYIKQKFLDFLEEGYGHADEQLFLAVYFDHPELFEFYYGDYQQMITNYTCCYENINFTIYLLISKSFQANDWNVCYNACKFVWNSHKKGTDKINNIREFINMYFISSLKVEKHLEFFQDFQNHYIDRKTYIDSI